MAIKKTSQQVQAVPTKTSKAKANENQIKTFINNADKPEQGGKNLDPKAVRSYKQLSVRLNEYEYRLLEKYSDKVRRSIADSMRDALIEKIKAEIDEG
jgi:hypothetical protein